MEEVFEFGRRLQADGQYEQAEKCYRRYLQDHAESHQAHTNLGVVLERQDRLDDAIRQFQRAVELAPDSAIPRYNLGHAFYRQDRLDEAADQFQAVLAQHPDHGAARLNLGVIRWRQEQPGQAEIELRHATRVKDVAARAHARLADFLFELGRYEESHDAYAEAGKLEESPTHFFHAAVCNQLLNNVEDAVRGFKRAIKLDPTARLLHEHHVRALIKLGDDAAIRQGFDDWENTIPDDPICAHMRAAYLQNDSVDRCSPDYVRDTFSAFAEDFDATLTKLGYHAPTKLSDALRASLTTSEPLGRVLDAGCGTGLCGPRVKPVARHLDGVDLAAPMLEKARALKVYDHLFEADLIEYLNDTSTPYDAIIAADTFNYFGRLDELLHACHRRLVDGGRLLFTLEQSGPASIDYRLMPHGRFEHGQNYVENALTSRGFGIRAFESFVLRSENGLEVNGWLIHAVRE